MKRSFRFRFHSRRLRTPLLLIVSSMAVPFALAAGLSGAVAASHLVVTAGFAEITAGAIAMGLGGYLATRGQIEHYDSERAREMREIKAVPHTEEKEVVEIFETYGVTADEIAPLVASLKRRPELWADFMMRFELGLERPNPRRAFSSAFTIGASYVVGGIVPLVPYMLLSTARSALYVSAACTVLALFIFGFVKGHFAGQRPLRSAVQTALIGSVAATAAFALARLF